MNLSGKFSQAIRSIASYREFALVVVLLVMVTLMTFVSPVFLTRANIEAILLGLSVEATIAVGMVILLIAGGLDLSVGSTMAFTGVVAGLLLTRFSVPASLAILFGLLAALLVGLANGLLVSKMMINPFIVTLGMMITVRGLTLVLASGKESDFYVDCKRTTLTAEGHVLVGRLLFDRVRRISPLPRGVGGLTLGADPIASAVAMASFVEREARRARDTVPRERP